MINQRPALSTFDGFLGQRENRGGLPERHPVERQSAPTCYDREGSSAFEELKLSNDRWMSISGGV